MTKITRNGDIIYFEIPIVNNGPFGGKALVTDQIPAGLKYVGHSVSKGVVTQTAVDTWTWEVELKAEEALTWTIAVKVVDITEAVILTDGINNGFINTAIITTNLNDPIPTNNTFTEEVAITTCPPSAGAVSIPNACLCGSVSTNSTPCDHGTTEYRLDPGSLVNLDVSFTVDVTTGEYNVSGKIINPYLPASFKFSIWCIVGANQYQTSGPATVTIPAFFTSSFTDVVTKLNGTVTHTSLDGTVTNWSEGWTSVTESSGAKTITFTYPDGSTTVVNISTWFTDTDTTVGNFTTSVGGFLQYDTINVKTGATSTVVTTIPVATTVNNVTTYDTSIYSGSTTFTNLTLKGFTRLNDSITNIDVILPDPATLGLPAGQTSEFTFKRVNETPRNGISFSVSNNKTIDGHTAVLMADEPQGAITFVHDNNNWFRI